MMNHHSPIMSVSVSSSVLITYIDEPTARYQVNTRLNYVNYGKNIPLFGYNI